MDRLKHLEERVEELERKERERQDAAKATEPMMERCRIAIEVLKRDSPAGSTLLGDFIKQG